MEQQEKVVELDDLFSSSSEEEEEPSQQQKEQQHADEEEEPPDYMDDQFIKSLENVQHEKLPDRHPSEAFPSKKLSFTNIPLDLVQAYNLAREEKQHKKAHHLKKQIRDLNIKEEMLEKAKLSLSKSLITQEEEKETEKQSIGLKFMKMMGFEQGSGLGKNGQGNIAPISIDKQLDHLMESSSASAGVHDSKKKINKPFIGKQNDETNVMKRKEIEKFKREMEKKKKAPRTTEEEFTKIMKRKHQQEKKKRKLRMALNCSGADETNSAQKVKVDSNDDEWEEFEDF